MYKCFYLSLRKVVPADQEKKIVKKPDKFATLKRHTTPVASPVANTIVTIASAYANWYVDLLKEMGSGLVYIFSPLKDSLISPTENIFKIQNFTDPSGNHNCNFRITLPGTVVRAFWYSLS